MKEEIKKVVEDAVISAFEVSLESQLRAVRKLRTKKEEPVKPTPRGKSQVDMTYDILSESHTPLHVNDILDRIRQHFAVSIDRESLVSSLTKKIKRHDRFFRSDKNTFGLLEWEEKR